ncbi:IclR family transcriptional regulator [Oceanobacillus polygoni]|uniref:DNA-binding IclR family transcriptional regulator n=1 Tax=Oceanobacillus polygoni TaxID=1235259 RepID=A0A9X0YNJ5_9BACI|nr:IclR family transcriptional regulator [Oceanobacillus polygoni]MBP2075858.1 DNA-binding IclR family transcriptional regulator [Oceanobacillus polygoni]
MGSNVISKTFKILRAFTDEKNEWGVNELSRHLEMPVSSLHRMITTLKQEYILEYSEQTNKYRIGIDFIRMASIISSNVNINKIVRPYLESLSTELHHSIYFAMYYSQYKKLSFIDSVKSSSALQYVLDLGVLEPIHIAASGKTILAYLSNLEVAAVLESEKVSVSEKNEILEELARIRSQGYAITANERKKGAMSIGSPIFNSSGEVIGSVICVIPISDYKKELENQYIKKVKDAAEDISYSLGYLGKPMERLPN